MQQQDEEKRQMVFESLYGENFLENRIGNFLHGMTEQL